MQISRHARVQTKLFGNIASQYDRQQCLCLHIHAEIMVEAWMAWLLHLHGSGGNPEGIIRPSDPAVKDALRFLWVSL